MRRAKMKLDVLNQEMNIYHTVYRWSDLINLSLYWLIYIFINFCKNFELDNGITANAILSHHDFQKISITTSSLLVTSSFN